MIHCYDAFGQQVKVGVKVGCFRGQRESGRFTGRVAKLTSVVEQDGKQVALRVVVEKDVPAVARQVPVLAHNLVCLLEQS